MEKTNEFLYRNVHGKVQILDKEDTDQDEKLFMNLFREKISNEMDFSSIIYYVFNDIRYVLYVRIPSKYT